MHGLYTNTLQDELEQEVERLKEKLSRSQKKSKNAFEATSSSGTQEPVAGTIAKDMGEVCEICEQPGHDIFNCDVLKGEAVLSRPVSAMSGQELYCEDCGEHGHVVTECPHSMDVF